MGFPDDKTGKTWRWRKRKCDCGDCGVCRNREANLRLYHRIKAGLHTPKRRPPVAPVRPIQKYSWDRT